MTETLTVAKIQEAQIKVSAEKTTTAERKIGSGGKPAHRPNFRRRFWLALCACLWRSEATPLVI